MRLTLLSLLTCSILCLTNTAFAQTESEEVLLQILKQFKIEDINNKPTVHVQIKDLLQLALERSVTLKSSKLSLQTSERALMAAQKRNFIHWKNELSVGQTISSANPSSSNFVERGQRRLTEFTTSLSRKFSSGVETSLSYHENRFRNKGVVIPTEGDDFVTMQKNEDYTSSNDLTLGVSVPIGQDWGAAVNDIPERLAEVGIEQTTQQVRLDQLNVLSDIASTYWNLVGIIESIKVQNDAVALSTQLLKDNQSRLDAGVLSRADVRITETQLAREQQVLLARQLDASLVEDQVRAALDLEQLDYGFYPIDSPKIHSEALNYKELLDKTYLNNPNLNALLASLKSKQYDLQTVMNKDRPNIDLNLSYTAYGYSEDPTSGYNYYGDQERRGYNAKVTWLVPLFDDPTQLNIQKTQLELQQSEMRIRDLRSKLNVQLQSNLRSLKLIEKEVATAQTAKNLADSQLKDEIDRFNVGKSTSFQVSQFQQEASNAKVQLILSRIKYENSFINLLVLTGELYRYFGLPEPVRS